MTQSLLDIVSASESLQVRLGRLHDSLLEKMPQIDRIGCAIYDPSNDLLRTFINSTRSGVPITAYEYHLANSTSLSKLALSRKQRVIDDIESTLQANNKHSAWVLEQGYKSSFTVPMYDQESFIGFLFFDSCQVAAFSPEIQRDLVMFSNIINMMLTKEFSAIRSINATVHMARDFANLRDFETGAHLERMSKNSRIIARHIAGKYGLNDEFIEYVYLFSPLHDIGKIGIPDAVLLKPGKLDADETAIMRTHVKKGVEMVDKILQDFNLKQSKDSVIMKNIVAYHHELMDGSGYPYGLKGDAIPVEARIITVADILDALVSIRPYKKKWSMDEAVNELKRMATSGKLDPDCVEAVEKNLAEISQVVEDHQDSAMEG